MRCIPVVVVVVLAGCVAPAVPDSDVRGDTSDFGRLVAVGFVDSGIDPFHSVFRSADWTKDSVQSLVGLEVTVVSGPTGDPETALAGLKPRIAYWFEGTRVVAVSLAPGAGFRTAGALHGTGVAGTAGLVAPEALLMVVVVDVEVTERHLLVPPPDWAEGVRWLAGRPGIGVISLSVGMPGGGPDHSGSDLPGAMLEAAAEGKIVVAAAGNTPNPAWVDPVAGPPWVIAVGGAEPSVNSTDPLAAWASDVVSNSTVRAPRAFSNESRWTGGTSFAAPTVAGVVAAALERVRAGSSPAAELCAAPIRPECARAVREGLNATARYFATTDYDPLGYDPGEEDPLYYVLYPHAPVNPVAPWVEMGWGYVGPDAVPRLVEWLESGASGVPPEKAAAAEHMAAVYEARSAYWTERARG